MCGSGLTSRCRGKGRFANELSNLENATHRRAISQEILAELTDINNEEASSKLLQEANSRIENSAQTASDALLKWVLLEETGKYKEDDYEYILNLGTALQNIATTLLNIASTKNGISDEAVSTLKEETSSLLKEIYLRNC